MTNGSCVKSVLVSRNFKKGFDISRERSVLYNFSYSPLDAH